MLQYLIQQPFVGVVVDDGQDTKGSIVQLIDGDVAGEVREAPVEIARPHLPRGFFPLQLPPSFGWWQTEQTPGDPATNANSRPDRVTRPPPRAARPTKPRGGCS